MVIGVRFAYGLRVAGPLLIGSSGLPAWRFALLNALGAMLWAGLVGGTGWLFGAGAERLLGRLQHYEGWLLLALLFSGAMTWLVQRARASRV